MWHSTAPGAAGGEGRAEPLAFFLPVIVGAGVTFFDLGSIRKGERPTNTAGVLAMSRFYTYPAHGFVVEADAVPAMLTKHLERRGIAVLATRTVDGVSVEPSSSLDQVLAVLQEKGLKVQNVRPGSATPSWHWSRSAMGSRQRLANPLSPAWLPTLRAA